MLDTVEGVCGYTVIQCIQPKSGYNADTMADTKVQSILGYKVADLYAARTAVGSDAASADFVRKMGPQGQMGHTGSGGALVVHASAID